jgi:small subunit ribosomal protein S8
MNDPISDMLTRIRNAYLSKHTKITAPYSGINLKIAEKLKQLGFLQEVSVDDSGKFKLITIELKYHQHQPVVTSIRRISTPGRRIYKSHHQLTKTRVLSGYGAIIISTSSGIMTDKEARTAKIGGEIICQVW